MARTLWRDKVESFLLKTMDQAIKEGYVYIKDNVHIEQKNSTHSYEAI
jgi:hypothetical protein